jgi:MFS family permease
MSLYIIAPPNMSETSPIEAVLAGNKPPWRPKVSGYVAFILGPVAGALVAAASFRSMGQRRKAQQTVFYTILLCIAFLIPFILGIPAGAPIKKIIGLAVEGAGYSVFPSVLREDYVKWKQTNPGVKPRNDYASIGWGVLGALMYLTMAALIMAFQR